jgi:hypothetical protein
MFESSIKGEFVRTLNRRIEQRTREELKCLDSAIDLRDLMIPPSNQRTSASGSGKSPKMQSACLGLPHFGRSAPKMRRADLPVQEPLERHTLSAHFTDTQSQ